MRDEMMRAWGRAIFFHVARPLIGVGFLYLVVGGCAYVARSMPTISWTPVPPSAPAPPPPPCPTLPPVRPVDVPKPAPPEIAKVDNGDRAKRITAARGDLKTGLTALELRTTSACTEPGTACVDNDELKTRAKAIDKQLAAALLDPQLVVNWAEVTTVLRAVVDTAMKGVPK